MERHIARWSSSLPVPVIVVSLAIVLSSCSGSSLTVAEYATELEDSTNGYILESQRVSTTFHSTVEDEVTRIAEAGEGDLLALATDVTSRETVLYLALLEDAMMRYVAVVEAIKPPLALVEPHAAYVRAIESVRSSMPATRTAVGDAATFDEIQVAIAQSGFSDGQIRLRAACVALETAVRAEGSGIDLGCTRPLEVDPGP
jgi:hypothetical protein